MVLRLAHRPLGARSRQPGHVRELWTSDDLKSDLEPAKPGPPSHSLHNPAPRPRARFENVAPKFSTSLGFAGVPSHVVVVRAQQKAAQLIKGNFELRVLVASADVVVLRRMRKHKSELRGENLKRGTKAHCMMEWWNKHAKSKSYCTWCRMIVRAALLQPSSASAGRVFSLLKRFFPGERATTLRDQMEAALMVAFNKRHPCLVSTEAAMGR